MVIEIAGTTPEGAPIHAATLANGELTARVLSFGAALQDLRLAGRGHPLMLGLADAADYARDAAPYFGVIVGRVANRIAGGEAWIAGQRHSFDRNEDAARTLHGGRDGSARRLWAMAGATGDSVTLTDSLPDGHMGFPGRLDVTADYRLDGPVLEIEITATCDAPTLAGFASHVYWNLSGAPSIDDHRLEVAADRYQPVDAGKIPVGEPAPVDGTRFDFRSPGSPAEIDHNLCLSDARRGVTRAARLIAPGLEMEIATTEPGLQVYDGGALNVPEGLGLDGRGYGPRAGLALEPQAWVDAANRPFRAQTDLAPGQVYRSLSRFAFRARP